MGVDTNNYSFHEIFGCAPRDSLLIQSLALTHGLMQSIRMCSSKQRETRQARRRLDHLLPAEHVSALTDSCPSLFWQWSHCSLSQKHMKQHERSSIKLSQLIQLAATLATTASSTPSRPSAMLVEVSSIVHLHGASKFCC